MTRFIGVESLANIVHETGIEPFLTGLAEHIEQDFRRWAEFDKVPRHASHSDLGVVELMPISDADRFAFKYVNGHPGNARAGLLTVAAFGVLADMVTGYPRLVAEMTAPARPSCSARSCCAQASSSNSKSRRGSRASCNRCPPTFR